MNESLKICVELSHPTPEHLNTGSTEAAFSISESIIAQGHNPNLMVFVDDIEITQLSMGGLRRVATQIKGEGLIADLAAMDHGSQEPFDYSFVKESDMIDRGYDLIEVIKAQAIVTEGARLSQDESMLILGSGKQRERIKIQGYGIHKDLPSCEVMDLACYEFKSFEHDMSVTVIDERYRSQQERVHKLASFLGWAGNVQIVYVNAQGAITDTYVWSDHPQVPEVPVTRIL